MKRNYILRIPAICLFIVLSCVNIYSMQQIRKRKARKSSEEFHGRSKNSDKTIVKREIIYVHKEWKRAGFPVNVLTNDGWAFVVPKHILIQLELISGEKNIIQTEGIYYYYMGCDSFELKQFLLTNCVSGEVEVDFSDVLQEMCGKIKSLNIL